SPILTRFFSYGPLGLAPTFFPFFHSPASTPASARPPPPPGRSWISCSSVLPSWFSISASITFLCAPPMSLKNSVTRASVQREPDDGPFPEERSEGLRRGASASE